MAKLTKEQVIQKVTQDIASKTEKNSISPGVLATIIIDAVQLINNVSEFDFVLDETNTVQGLSQGLNFKEGISAIADYAFSTNDRRYSKVTLPSTLTTIGRRTFYYNFIGGVMTIPDSVTTIEYGAFEDNQIEEVIFEGTGPITIEDYAFTANNLSGSITIEPRFTIFGSPFGGNLGITEAIFEEGVTEIGGFNYCQNLVTVSMPSTATIIKASAFRFSKLTSIDLSTIQEIERYAFYNSSFSTLTIPDNVNLIGVSAFRDSPITTLSFIGTSPLTLEDESFRGTSLTAVTIPSNIIMQGTPFSYNSNLLSVTFENGVTEMTGFRYCPLLATINCLGSGVTVKSFAFANCGFTEIDLTNFGTIEANAFANNNIATITDNKANAFIPAGAFSDNPVTTINIGASSSVTIEAGAFYSTGSGTVPIETLNITGTAIDINIEDKALMNNNITAPFNINTTGAVTIGPEAFRQNSIPSVDLAAPTVNIGQKAFQFNSITSLTFSTTQSLVLNSEIFSGNGQLGNIVFNCTGDVTLKQTCFGYMIYYPLTSFDITTDGNITLETVFHAGSYSSTNTNLTSLTLSTSQNLVIGDGNFGTYEGLSTIVLNGLSIDIGTSCFHEITIPSITFNTGDLKIGSESFNNCPNLTSVTFQPGSLVISANAFKNTGLTSVDVPVTATIDPTAFDAGVTINYVL